MNGKNEIERAIERSLDEAKYQYRRGNLTEGNKAEKNAKELKKILKLYL